MYVSYISKIYEKISSGGLEVSLSKDELAKKSVISIYFAILDSSVTPI